MMRELEMMLDQFFSGSSTNEQKQQISESLAVAHKIFHPGYLLGRRYCDSECNVESPRRAYTRVCDSL